MFSCVSTYRHSHTNTNTHTWTSATILSGFSICSGYLNSSLVSDQRCFQRQFSVYWQSERFIGNETEKQTETSIYREREREWAIWIKIKHFVSRIIWIVDRELSYTNVYFFRLFFAVPYKKKANEKQYTYERESTYLCVVKGHEHRKIMV